MKKTAVLGMYLAFAMILSYIEFQVLSWDLLIWLLF